MKTIKTKRSLLKISLAFFLFVFSAHLQAQDFPSTYKGFNFGWWGDTDSSDAIAVKNMGANTVRLVFRWYRAEGKSHDSYDPNGTAADGYITKSFLWILDDEIKWLEDQGLNIILAVEAAGGSTKTQNFWSGDQTMRTRYKKMWEFLIKRYKHKSNIKAWELLSEPHPHKFYGDNFGSERIKYFYTDVIKYLLPFATKNKPFVVGPQRFYRAEFLEDNLVITDQTVKPRVVYAFNLLIHDKPEEVAKSSWRDLRDIVDLALDFKTKHNVKIYCDQVGCELSVANSDTILTNMINMLDNNSIPWTYWNWRGGVFNVRNRDGSYVTSVRNYFRDDVFGGTNNSVVNSEHTELNITDSYANNDSKSSVFPNPTNRYININTKGFLNAKLCSLEGKILGNYTSNKIDISLLKSGIYVLTVNTTEGAFIKKIIKI
ncbi:cellulase family glycosylhydrolase [Wenyingzhuangia sp. IMCC45574]